MTTQNGFQAPRGTSDDHLEVTAVDIAADGLANISGLLSGLYQDGPFAIFREYTSNALDSHTKAGTLKIKPIKISMGNEYIGRNDEFQTYDGKKIKNTTYFVVQDYGTGMSHDEMKTNYMKYGASTKQGDRTAIGRFGVGAKAALSVTDYFEIVSVKDGQRVLATVEKDNATGLAHMYTKTIEPTSEENGVKVSVPIPRTFIASIKRKLDTYFQTWEKGTVLINGEHPQNIEKLLNPEKYLKIVGPDGVTVGWVGILDSAKVTPRAGYYSYREFPLYMGGVPYHAQDADISQHDLPATLSALKETGHEILLNMPTTSLHLTPNREQLKRTEENKTRLLYSYQMLADAITGTAIAHLNGLSRQEAHIFYANNLMMFQPSFSRRTRNYEPLEDVYHQGRKLNTHLDLSNYSTEEILWRPGTRLHHVFKHQDIPLHLFNSSRPLGDAFYRESHSTDPMLSVVVWGKYTGKAKDVFAVHLKNAMKQAGHQENIIVNVIHLNSDVRPSQEIYDSTRVFHMEEMLELAKKWRDTHYMKPVRRPSTAGKTVENSYYIVFSRNADDMQTIQLWNKADVKNAKEKFYFLQEASYSHRYGRANSQYWDGYRKAFKTVEETTEIYYYFQEVASVVAHADKPVVLLPTNKSLDAFLNAASDKALPYGDFVVKTWEALSNEDKMKVALVRYHIENPLVLAKSGSFDQVENETLQIALKATTEKQSIYRQLAMLFKKVKQLDVDKDIRNLTDSYTFYNSQLLSPTIELYNKMVELTDL